MANGMNDFFTLLNTRGNHQIRYSALFFVVMFGGRGFHKDEKLRYIINVRPPRELEVEILDETCVYVLSEVSQPHPLTHPNVSRYVSSRLRRTVWNTITIDGSVEPRWSGVRHRAVFSRQQS